MAVPLSRCGLWAGCLIALVSCVGCGCKSTVVERDVQVTLDDDLVGKPVTVALYAANASERDIWANYPVDEFFTPRNALRPGALKGEVAFDAGRREKVKTFTASDPLWAKWKERAGQDLVVLTYIPDAEPWKGPAQFDPRRQVLPLDRCKWRDTREPIRLQVHSGSVTVENPPAK